MLKPRHLSPGDRIAIVAPAGKLKKGSLDQALKVLNSWNLEVIIGDHVYNTNHYFSGTDEERLTDLQKAINDPTIGAILCARGGYGTTRIIDNLELKALKNYPKWIIGYSDITALHLKMLNENFLSIHGDVGTTLGSDHEATQALYELLFNERSILQGAEPIRNGETTAEITGGNLSLIVDSLGGPNEIDSDGRILFIEEIGEKAYRIDRMMIQLLRAGKLNNLAGLAIGHFTYITSDVDYSWQEIITDIIKEFNYPVALGYKVGHEANNYPIIHGAKYKFKVAEKGSSLSLANS